jgi:hypothetical protein
MYNDEYPTCARTYATLRLYPGEIDPSSVTQRLGIEPTEWQRSGELWLRSGRPLINGWFLRSRDHVESRDSRRHVDWLLDRVAPKAEAIKGLQETGCKMDISCYWLSRSGHGGPTVSPSQMARLAELNIGLWFDFYGPYEEADA